MPRFASTTVVRIRRRPLGAERTRRGGRSGARQSGVSRILVTGHADRAGTDDYNLDLSRRRAEAVKREMIRNGLDEDSIVVAAHGDRDPAVATAPGVRDPENRRVVITWKRDANWKQAAR